ncbi:hypothetical protein BDR26DRAFT_1011033 [Obelidium mucronatum]|nr:hypothetical protein BDR26DRAFT_1011033 [Obelidium mucronatum]
MANIAETLESLLAKKALLDKQLEVITAEVKAKEEREAQLISEAQAKLVRIKQRAGAKEGFSFKFPRISTPLKDLQIAYRYLPSDVLPADQVEILDQAVEEGDMSPLIDIFCDIANRPENLYDMLLQTLQNKASDHEESPNAYYNDAMRAQTQQVLSVGLMWHLV